MEGIGNPKLVQSDIFLLLEPLTLMEGSQATRRGEAAPATGALALMGGSQAAKTASVVRYRTSHNGSKGPYPLAADSLKSFRRGHPVLVQKVSGMSPSEGGISTLFDHWTGPGGCPVGRAPQLAGAAWNHMLQTAGSLLSFQTLVV